MKQFLYLSDVQHPDDSVETWRISVLRIILLSGFLLCLWIVVHSSYQAITVNLYHVIVLCVSFYAVMGLLLWASRRHYSIAAYGLLVTILAAGVCINLFAISGYLHMFGALIWYATPLVALLLLGTRAALGFALLNILAFMALLAKLDLSQYSGIERELPDANLYIQALVFMFFNGCLPLAAARTISAANKLSEQRRLNIQMLTEQNALYQSLFLQTAAAQLIVDENERLVDINARAINVLELDAKPVDGTPLSDLLLHVNVRNHADGRLASIECAHRHYEVASTAMQAEGHYLLTLNDISAKKHLRVALQHHDQAEKRARFIDGASGLHNRAWLQRGLQEWQPAPGGRGKLLAVNVRNHGYLEQRFGQRYYLDVLRLVANNLQQLLATVGMSQPVCLLNHRVLGVLCDGDQIAQQRVFEQLADVSLSTGVDTPQGRALPDLRLGVATVLPSTQSREQVIDNAIYAAEHGVAFCNDFTPEHREAFLQQQEITLLLSEAIDEQELGLAFQPKVTGQGSVIGMEALLRWRSAVLGNVSPAMFIPMAEQANLIQRITLYVIEQVCKHQQRWQAQGYSPVPVAVNISALDLDQPTFVTQLTQMLQRYAVRPQQVVIELTESAASIDPDATLQGVRTLREWGFYVALDDFGAGYSGLAKLTHLPVDEIKIDRHFVTDIESNHRKQQVLGAIYAMCESLGIHALVEGIERDEQFHLLASLGYDLFQGFGFSRPLSIDAVDRWYANGQPALSLQTEMNREPTCEMD
ncbi:EAL domain-containing protein [Aestuariibacter halophilus]|uniref:EAL domain-containing protein n=1 Tax=Fluctibacter halophilus TaxID=226011 RepID=A0ABS8GBZ2_9ALTE|nr:EAL domain-containing protein [Aestuariibacter halophilus]MCC2616726.1 EAL domain-containing protein [Aestuariibacter halophilus]